IPYSCHAQFGTSGIAATPCGPVLSVRGIGFSMSHSSTDTRIHTATRAPRGSFQRGRVAIGEKSKRSRGSLISSSAVLARRKIARVDGLLEEVVGIVLPELAHRRERVDHRVLKLAAHPLDLPHVDVLHGVAVAVDGHRAARGLPELDVAQRTEER